MLFLKGAENMNLKFLDSTFSYVKFSPNVTIPLWALNSDVSLLPEQMRNYLSCPSKQT